MPLNPHTQAVHMCEDINQEAKSNPHYCDILGTILTTNGAYQLVTSLFLQAFKL